MGSWLFALPHPYTGGQGVVGWMPAGHRWLCCCGDSCGWYPKRFELDIQNVLVYNRPSDPKRFGSHLTLMEE